MRTFSIKPPKKVLIKNLMHLREALGEQVIGRPLTQTEFAQLIGATRQAVSAWESGKAVPHGIALRMIEVLEKHPDVLLERVDYHGKGRK